MNALANKVKSIELIDEKILAPVLKALKEYGDFKVMVLPDHPTPISIRTHARDAVPYLIYQHSNANRRTVYSFDEKGASESGVFIEHGSDIMKRFLKD